MKNDRRIASRNENKDVLNVVVRFIVFLTPAILIFRGTDISKCFKESLGLSDIDSRLYNARYDNSIEDVWEEPE